MSKCGSSISPKEESVSEDERNGSIPSTHNIETSPAELSGSHIRCIGLLNSSPLLSSFPLLLRLGILPPVGDQRR
jgi:hypothetical protein